MNFFQTLLRPDHEEDPERALIVHAANLLQIGEFQLLQLAFADWHGRDMTEEEQAAHFQGLFLRQHVPPYLRHYARKVIELEGRGELDDRAGGYHRFDNDYFQSRMSNGARRFLVAVTLVVGVVGGGIAMASYTVDQVGRCTDELPPCFTQQDLAGSTDAARDRGAMIGSGSVDR